MSAARRRRHGELVVGAAMLVLVLSGLTAMAQSSNAIVLPDNPLKGRALYESKQCVQCHGIAGSPGIGPILGESDFSGTFLELGAALWNHVPGMSVTIEVAGLAWPQLNRQQAIDLVAFLYFIDYLGRPGVAGDGRRVFEAEGCSACHVIGGGKAGVGPDLAGLQHLASPLSVAQEIWNHGPSMFEQMQRLNVSLPLFDEGDLADVSAYIRQQAGPGPKQPLLLTPGNPNSGGDLFATKGCASCHGRDARGGPRGPDLATFELRSSAEAIAATMWNHGLAMRDAMQEQGLAWPRFEGSELADLVAFLYFLPFHDPPGDPARGAEVFVDRSCSACHARGEEGVPRTLPGPPLEGSSAAASPAALVSAMWNHAPLMKAAILGRDLPWPELSGADLRDLQAYLMQAPER